MMAANGSTPEDTGGLCYSKCTAPNTTNFPQLLICLVWAICKCSQGHLMPIRHVTMINTFPIRSTKWQRRRLGRSNIGHRFSSDTNSLNFYPWHEPIHSQKSLLKTCYSKYVYYRITK